MRYSNLFAKTKRDAPADITDETLRLAYRAGLIRPVEHGQLDFSPPRRECDFADALDAARGFAATGRARVERGWTAVARRARICRNSIVQAAARADSLVQPRDDASPPEYRSKRTWTRQKKHMAHSRKSRAIFLNIRVLSRCAQRMCSLPRCGTPPRPQRDVEIFKSNGYAATRAAAKSFKPAALSEALLERQLVETPHCDTIEALARYLNVPTSRTAKAVFFSTGDRVIFAVVRGDLQIDENKVKRALGLETLRWATDEEIARVGAVPGYASPVGTRGATIIVDDSVANSPNLVAGANQAGYHLLNTNVPRDFSPDVVTDIALVRPGDVGPDGSGRVGVGARE